MTVMNVRQDVLHAHIVIMMVFRVLDANLVIIDTKNSTTSILVKLAARSLRIVPNAQNHNARNALPGSI